MSTVPDARPITDDEVESVFFVDPVFCRYDHSHGRLGSLYAVMGETEAGRHLVLLFAISLPNAAQVLAARDMDEREKRLYARR